MNTITTRPLREPLVTSLAALKRALDEPGVTVELVEAWVPQGALPAFRADAIGKPRRVVKRQTNGFYVQPYEGQKTSTGAPMGHTWFEYGKASRWSFALLDGDTLATIDDGQGYGRTYRIAIEVTEERSVIIWGDGNGERGVYTNEDGEPEVFANAEAARERIAAERADDKAHDLAMTYEVASYDRAKAEGIAW